MYCSAELVIIRSGRSQGKAGCCVVWLLVDRVTVFMLRFPQLKGKMEETVKKACSQVLDSLLQPLLKEILFPIIVPRLNRSSAALQSVYKALGNSLIEVGT